MSFEHLPADIEQGVQNCASAWHVTHDEAVLRLLETGLTVLQANPGSPVSNSAEDLRAVRKAVRHAKLASLANTPPERASLVFGAFAETPGFQDSIDEVISHRGQHYGLTE